MKTLTSIAIILLTFLSACSQGPEVSTVDADAIGRHILGPALSTDQPVEISDKKPEDIIASLALTRAKGWEIFGQVIAEETLKIESPTGESLSVNVPRFLTWYSPEDVNRLFSLSLDQLDEGGLERGDPLSESLWSQSQTLLLNELKTMPSPVQKKWAKFFDTNTALSREAVMGASGLPRTLFNSALIGSVAKQYANLQNCYPELQKPPFDFAYKPCFANTLSSRSMMIKTNWLNIESGFRQYSTDDQTLSKLFHDPESSWDDIKVTAEVPANIVKATLGDKSFVLGGMHIVSKEFEDWIWVSAWWSADPNSDFGEDRPQFIQKLGAPWNQYKICAVSRYVQSPADLDELAKTYPSLAKAYRSVLNDSGASWCSNPYIERGRANQRTNCIGCHQFAGTDVTQAEIISDTNRFPFQGTLKTRSDFPSDYIWSATQGQISWLATLNNLRSVH
ncbi:MAG: hypothetical protein EOP10_04345 [Proteobacteria bacterium]|nr:MAG: hypothetical protein EOP10_04345 [Pseudomonadota bacterium]